MSDKKYTVTVYLAAPGTLVANKNGTEYSLPGHAYYAVSDGVAKQGFGFAPTSESVLKRMIGPGKVQPNEYTKYQNPQYERTMEITEAQYNALLSFGKRPKETAGFNEHHYNFANNSCVDFTFTALKHAGIYKGQKTSFTDEMGGEHSYINSHYEGAIKVLPNIRELENISDPIPGSPLNKTIHRDPPKQNTLQKLLGENEQEQPYRYAETQPRSLTIEDMSQKAQELCRQCREHYVAFHQAHNLSFTDLKADNVSAAIGAEAYLERVPHIQALHINKDGIITVGHETPAGDLTYASLDVEKAAATPVEESVARARQAEQVLAQQDRQLEMEIAEYLAQSRGRTMG